MGLSRNEHQGLYGEVFVRSLATAAGLIAGKLDLDTIGEDFTIAHKGQLGPTRHPKIDVQVKSWSHRRAQKVGGVWKFKLKAKHFNELAGTDFSLPRYLILVIVPDDWSDYATAAPQFLTLRQAAYWRGLQDRERVNLPPETLIPVDVPEANLLTVDTLLDLIAKPAPARKGV